MRKNSDGLPAGGTIAGVANVIVVVELLVTSTPAVALSLPISVLLKRAPSGDETGAGPGAGAGVGAGLGVGVGDGAGDGAGAGVGDGGRTSGGGGGAALALKMYAARSARCVGVQLVNALMLPLLVAIALLSRTRIPASVEPARREVLKMSAGPWQLSQDCGVPPGIGTGVLYRVAPFVAFCASADPLNPTTASAAMAGGRVRRCSSDLRFDMVGLQVARTCSGQSMCCGSAFPSYESRSPHRTNV